MLAKSTQMVRNICAFFRKSRVKFCHVIFAELDWVLGILSQAEDRCHRIGQTEPVLVQHLVVEGSIDALIAHSVVNRQEVLDLALDEEMDPRLRQELINKALKDVTAMDLSPSKRSSPNDTSETVFF